jgi:hypothetical protein
MPQFLLDRPTQEVQPAVVAAPTFVYIVVLLNRKTEDEQSFEIETLTESFCDVLNVIHSERVERGLLGYEILEVLDRTPPF